jgi:hypothetical protein
MRAAAVPYEHEGQRKDTCRLRGAAAWQRRKGGTASERLTLPASRLPAYFFRGRIGLEDVSMLTILIIVLLIVLLGGGGGYYGYRTWGGPGLGGALGLVLIVLFVAWLAGGLAIHPA